MIAAWVALAVVAEVALARLVGCLFKRQEAASDFDVHAALALAVVAEPSDDFDLWAAEIRGVR